VKKALKCKFCKKKKMEYELEGGRFNYDFICPRCKKRNIGTIVEKLTGNKVHIDKNTFTC
jgi:hypothetical protein